MNSCQPTIRRSLSSILPVAILLLIGCQHNGSITGVDNTPEPKELNIIIDPRVELLSVVQHFTSWGDQRHTKLHFQYKQDLHTYFSSYSDHPAIQTSETLTNQGFSYDAPPTFVLYHSAPPEFEQLQPYSDYLISRAGGETKLIDFAEKLRGFAIETDFMSFFSDNQNLYTQIEDEVGQTVGDTKYIQFLEEYYGEQKHTYHIILAPLLHAGGYGPQIETVDGPDIYNIMGPVSTHNNKPQFGTREYFLHILLHEFSHSFVNPVTKKNAIAINRSNILLEPILLQMQQQGYNNWQTCVNEHLVRANVVRFALSLEGEQTRNDIINYELGNGFIYITHLDTLMARYEDSRHLFPNYESFYPEIIELFDSLAQSRTQQPLAMTNK